MRFGDWPASFQRIKCWPPQGRRAGLLAISDRWLVAADGLPAIVYRPPTLVLGVGCRRGVPCAEIEALFREVCRTVALSPLSLGLVATASLKADEPGLLEFAERHGVSLQAYPSMSWSGVGVPAHPQRDGAGPSRRCRRGGAGGPAGGGGEGRAHAQAARPAAHHGPGAEGRRMTVYFIGAGPGRPGPDHGPGPAADRAVPGLPVRRVAGAAGGRRLRPAGRPGAEHGELHLDQIIALMDEAHRRRPRRGPGPLRRPEPLRRDRRADAPARRAGHPLRGRARASARSRRRRPR